MKRKENTITNLVLYYIKEHGIKNNIELAKLLDTKPSVIAVIKNRLYKRGLITKEEAFERKTKKVKKSKTILDIFK